MESIINRYEKCKSPALARKESVFFFFSSFSQINLCMFSELCLEYRENMFKLLLSAPIKKEKKEKEEFQSWIRNVPLGSSTSAGRLPVKRYLIQILM